MKNRKTKIKLFITSVVLFIITYFIGFEKGKNLIIKTIFAKDGPELRKHLRTYANKNNYEVTD